VNLAILACGDGTDARGVTWGVAVGAQQMTFVRDPEPFDPGPRSRAGLVARANAAATTSFGALQGYAGE